MDSSSRPFAPTNLFDRILYVLMALLLPYSICATWFVSDLDWTRPILGAWWLIATIHTIHWAIVSYRRWRSRVSEDVSTLP